MRDPFGFDAFRVAFEHLQELLGELYLTDPLWFWMVTSGLTAVAFALAAHILWSVWALYRSMQLTPDSGGRMSAPKRDYDALINAALAAEDVRRAVELSWLKVCSRFDVSLSDTPRTQLKGLLREVNREHTLGELLALRERAGFGPHAPAIADARYAVRIAQELTE